jgi:hypothetical protein
MQARRTFFALATLLALAGPLVGQELPHVDFVRALRARHAADLALDYLQRIRETNPPDKDGILLLELARTRLALAEAETDSKRRSALQLQAENDLNLFLQKNVNTPLTTEANLEIAHLKVAQGRNQLSKALQTEPQLAYAEALRARDLLTKAGQTLRETAAKIDQQRAAYGDVPLPPGPKADEKKSLDHARLEVDFDLARNFLDQALTYLDRGVNEDVEIKAKVIGEAIKLLERPVFRDAKEPLSWPARAWLGRCLFEIDKKDEAVKKLEEVINDKSKAAETAQPLARYFLMLVRFENRGNKPENRGLIQADATQWLRDNPKDRTSPESFGVRYLLARVDFELSLDPRYGAQKAQNLSDARQWCKDLERTENDFALKSREIRFGIAELDGAFKKPIKGLADFDDCLLRAQYEAYQLSEDVKKAKDPKQAEEARQKRLAAVIEALEEALDRDAKAQERKKALPQDLGQAQSMLIGYYLFTNKLDQAIKVGEPMIHTSTPNPQTTTVAGYVLGAYAERLGAKMRAGEPEKEWQDERKKFWDLAETIVATWPNESAADNARHQMALQLLREKKYTAALDLLAQIKEDYPGILLIHSLQAEAALRAEADGVPLPAGDRKSWQDRAEEALEKIGDLPAGADEATTEAFLQAKYRQGLLLFNARKFEIVEQLLDPLLQRLPALRFANEERRTISQNSLALLRMRAHTALAGREYGSGRYAKVRELLDPVVEEIRADRHPEIKQEPQVAKGLLALDLAASVQDNQLPRAQEILEVLRKVSAQDNDGGAGILQSVAQLVQDQVRELKSKGNAAELQQSVAGFTTLLDALAKQETTPSPETLRLLAMSYASLDQHDKAIDLLDKVTEPKAVNGAEPDERLVKNYQASRMLYLREVRLARRLDQADKTLQEIQAQPWGKNLDVTKESYLLKSAHGNNAQAFTDWTNLINKSLLPKVSTDPKIKEQYFECYSYLLTSMMALAQDEKDSTKKAKIVHNAADRLTQLEKNWPDLGGEVSKARFQQLLNAEPALKAEYEKLKAGK